MRAHLCLAAAVQSTALVSPIFSPTSSRTRQIIARAEPELWPLETFDEDDHFVHLFGIPWELSNDDVHEAITPMLPPACNILDSVLPLDKRARTTGRAMLRLEIGAAANASDVIDALQGQHVGSRWLAAKLSQASEYAKQKREAAAIMQRVNGRARQAYCRPTEQDSYQLPTDERDLVLLCHGTSAAIGSGQIDLNNLPHGRLDVLARCVAAALFVSHGIRSNTRIWLLLRDVGLTIRVDGSNVTGLHPDERTLAAAIRRTLLSRTDTTPRHIAPDGWSVHGCMESERDPAYEPTPESLTERLSALVGTDDESVRFVTLHEHGEPLAQVLSAQGASEAGGGEARAAHRTVMVFGDHLGFTEEEEELMEELGATRASLGAIPLLASHCIVLAHHQMDAC